MAFQAPERPHFLPWVDRFFCFLCDDCCIVARFELCGFQHHKGGRKPVLFSVFRPLRLKSILDPASCKPIFVAPHSSLPTPQQHHVLHLWALHITHSVGNEHQIYLLSIATARNALLSTATVSSAFVPIATHVAAVCVSPRQCIYRVSSLSFITSSVMTSW